MTLEDMRLAENHLLAMALAWNRAQASRAELEEAAEELEAARASVPAQIRLAPPPHVELLAIVREIAEGEDWQILASVGEDCEMVCRYCEYEDLPIMGIDGEQHSADCMRVRAKQIVARLAGGE